MEYQRPLTIVVDTSVMVHDLHHKHNILPHTHPHWSALIKAQLNWLMSGDWLGDLKPEKFQVIFVTDSKPYWRTDYLLRPDVIASVPRKKKPDEKRRLRFQELLADIKAAGDDLNAIAAIEDSDEYKKLKEALDIHYKAGRKFPDYSFTKLKKQLLEVIKERKWTLLGKSGYEADDLAATIVAVNNRLENPGNVMLLTIDSDWLGLVNQNTSWFCSHGWFPRLRSDLLSVNQWATRRLGGPVENFRDIWEVKGVSGDKSDNIPPSEGVLLPIIDLLNPPDEHKLWNQPIGAHIEELLTQPKFRKVDPTAARQYIESLGINLLIRPLDPKKDLLN